MFGFRQTVACSTSCFQFRLELNIAVDTRFFSILYAFLTFPPLRGYKRRQNIVFYLNRQKLIGECLKTTKRGKREREKEGKSMNEINQPCKIYHFVVSFLFVVLSNIRFRESFRSIDEVKVGGVFG